MPARNVEHFVGEAIEGLLRQSYPHWELLIADDGSSDGTRARIDAYSDPRIRRFHQDERRGKVPTFNALLSEARGELIAPHDADDVSDPHRLKRSWETLQLHPDADLVCCDLLAQRRDRGAFDQLWRAGPAGFDHRRLLRNGLSLPYYVNGLLIRRSLTDRVGGLHPAFGELGMLHEDIEWMARMLDVGARVVCLPEPLYFYRVHYPSLMRSGVKFRRQAQSILVSRASVEEILARRYADGVDLLCSQQSERLAVFRAASMKRTLASRRAFLRAALGAYDSSLPSAWLACWRQFWSGEAEPDLALVGLALYGAELVRAGVRAIWARVGRGRQTG